MQWRRKMLGDKEGWLSTHCGLKKFAGKRKNLSVSAPSVPAKQLSASVLAEQLSAIEVGVKKAKCGIRVHPVNA